jgi:hypothetical protein
MGVSARLHTTAFITIASSFLPAYPKTGEKEQKEWTDSVAYLHDGGDQDWDKDELLFMTVVRAAFRKVTIAGTGLSDSYFGIILSK